MISPRAQAISAVLVLLVSPVYAGDLAVLPKDDAGFREKIGAFIRPGARAGDAQRLLESDRFNCQKGMDADGPYLWCGRSDGSPMAPVLRRYQVMMRTAGASVTSVKTSTGLVGP
jgi:hypothetical protein